MAFSFFLNMEKTAMTIVENEISQMTDNNTCIDPQIPEGEVLDVEAFENNMLHGVVAVSFLVNLYESALNAIISRRLNIMSVEILKLSLAVKLELICFLYQVDLTKVKSDNSYSILQKTIKIRNDITHFKTNEIHVGGWVDGDLKMKFGTSKELLSEVFTRQRLNNYFKEIMAFLKKLCKECGLSINENCLILDCDGINGDCEFIIKKKE